MEEDKFFFFFFQAEDGIRDHCVTGVQTCALPICPDGTPFSSLVSWGDRPHQQGDRRYLIGTGPAATEVMAHSSDGLGNRIIGTGFGCSGALTPWGTVLSCEENFQGGAGAFFVGVQENVLPDGTQTGYVVGTPATFTDPVSGQTFHNYTTGTF